MATIDNTLDFHNQSRVVLTQTYAAAALPASDVVKMIEVKKGFRVTKVTVTFDDLGTGTTIDVGDSADPDRYVDGADTASEAGSASWAPADSRGYLYTADDVIQITNLGAAATGDIRVDVEGQFDYS